MRHLLAAIPSTLALVASGLALTATPASAYETRIGSLSTETPGHVTGTVISDAPFLWIAATSPGGPAVDQVAVEHEGGRVAVDLETWGLTEGELVVWECSRDLLTCSDPVISPVFTATDVTPAVTFPADTTIGQEDYLVSVEDPDGGGVLRLRSGASSAHWQTMSASGVSAPVTFPGDGAGTVELFRCSSLARSICVTTGQRREVTVNRQVAAHPDNVSSPISTRLGTPFTADVRIIDPETTGPVTLTWQVARSGSPVEGYAGVLEMTRDTDGRVHPDIHLGGLPEGSYDMRLRPSTTTDDFGTVIGPETDTAFTVDNTPPPVDRVAVPRNDVYPYPDRYRDTTTIEVFPGYAEGGQTVEVDLVRKATGTRVRVLSPADGGASPLVFRWDGRDDAGNPVAGGQYRIRVRAWDEAGNTTRRTVAEEITVVRKKLEERRLRRTVRATGSLRDQLVGSCSTLRRPALRGWPGSLGLYSNTRCVRDRRAGLVESRHSTRVPAGVKYGDVRVSLHGGAATTRPRSTASLRYWMAPVGKWSRGTVLKARLGHHTGPAVPARRLLAPDRSLTWATRSVDGARYDIKSFSIRMNYWVLVPE